MIDMQNDFVTGAALGTEEAQAVVPAVEEKIKTFIASGDDVVFTRDTHTAAYLDTMEGRKLPVPHCIYGTPGWEIIPQLTVYVQKVFDKPTFGSVALAQYAAEQRYREITLTGLCTDICVISNALLLRAYLPECEIIVDSACCAGVTPRSHSNALEAMKPCQITVR